MSFPWLLDVGHSFKVADDSDSWLFCCLLHCTIWSRKGILHVLHETCLNHSSESVALSTTYEHIYIVFCRHTCLALGEFGVASYVAAEA